MTGIKQADLDPEPIVVNIAFPDHTNHILSKAGLDVSCGGGTTDLTATALQYLVAKKYNEAYRNVKISLVCHHALRSAPITKDMYHLKVVVRSEDVTDELDEIAMLNEAVHMTIQGENAGITAASGIKYLLPQMFEHRSIIGNTPGPSGLTGGYPVYVDIRGVRPLFPKNVSKAEINNIMKTGLKVDGVEKVDNKGTVYFTEDAQHLMSTYLGIDRKTMKIDESHDMTLELLEGYKKLDEEYKDIDIGRFF
jgi:hypothetical protein